MPEIRNIAIVDDHIMFRKGLKSLVNLFPGYQVLFDAANGRDFINQLDPSRLPDIVLMDINMPEMDGYETTEWLRNQYPEIAVIALSTMDADTAIIKMIKNGAKGYVLKDVDTTELKAAFDNVINIGYFYNETVSRKVLQSVSQITGAKTKVGTFINLTDRETEFLKLVCSELTYKEIADKMYLSVRTVEGYRDSLCEKLELKSRVGLAMYAIKNGIISL